MARERWRADMLRYVACSALALLGYKKLAHPLDVADAGLLLAGVAVGMAAAAVICDVIRPRRAETVAAISALLAAAIAPATALDARWLPAVGFAAAVPFLMLQVRGLRALPGTVRCTAFAAVFASAGAVNTLTSLAELPALRVDSAPGTTFYAAILLACDAALIFTTRRRAPAGPTPRGQPATRWLPVAGLSVLAATLAYVVFAVEDSPAYPAALDAASSTGWIRLVEVPLFVAVGLICDRFGPRIVMIASLCAGLLASAGPLLPADAPVRLVLLGCAFASILAFAVAMVGMLAQHSMWVRRPGALCASALIPVIVGQAVAVPVRELTAGADPVQLFCLGFVPGVALVPVVFLLLDQLRLPSRRPLVVGPAEPTTAEPSAAAGDMSHAARPALGSAEPAEAASDGPASGPDGLRDAIAPPFAERWGLTRREAEVFDLVLEELTVPEMAQALFVTTSTVKQHVGHLLKKSRAASRAELLASVRAEWPGAPGPRPDRTAESSVPVTLGPPRRHETPGREGVSA